tara:strand:- start:179 stop:700 length:522 start_codon:yes stop_codon:yes gene_type:complete
MTVTIHPNGKIDGLNNNNFRNSMPTGSVINFASAKKLGTQRTDSTSFIDITDLSCTITPSSSSSKIYIAGSLQVNKENYTAIFRLMRDSTEIGTPSASGGVNNIMTVYTQNNNGSWRATFQWDDTPGDTNPHVYKLQMRTDGGGDPTTMVGGHHDNDASYTSPCYMTVMELAG